MARIPSYFLHFSSSWPFSIQDVVQPLTLRVQRPLVSVVSVSHRESLGLEGKFPTPGPGLDLTHALPSDGVRCLLGLRTAVVTFRPFHGVSSKVLTVLTLWWLGETHLKVKEVAVSALSICRSFNIQVLPQRQYKVFTTSPTVTTTVPRKEVSEWRVGAPNVDLDCFLQVAPSSSSTAGGGE